jgi:hypothetical protein
VDATPSRAETGRAKWHSPGGLNRPGFHVDPDHGVQLRAAGKDPTATPQAQARLAASMAKRRAEQRAWDRDHPERPDPELYRREIFPQVEQMSLKAIDKDTGLSAG